MEKEMTDTGLRAPAWILSKTSPGDNFFGTGQLDLSSRAFAGSPWRTTSHAFCTSGISAMMVENLEIKEFDRSTFWKSWLYCNYHMQATPYEFSHLRHYITGVSPRIQAPMADVKITCWAIRFQLKLRPRAVSPFAQALCLLLFTSSKPCTHLFTVAASRYSYHKVSFLFPFPSWRSVYSNFSGTIIHQF